LTEQCGAAADLRGFSQQASDSEALQRVASRPVDKSPFCEVQKAGIFPISGIRELVRLAVVSLPFVNEGAGLAHGMTNAVPLPISRK
jgi:hypothetical protein